MTVALITHPACLGHDTGPWHPECADRLRFVLRALESEEFLPLLREEAPRATVAQLALVHPQLYIESILAIRPEEGESVPLDGDTVMSAGTPEAIFRQFCRQLRRFLHSQYLFRQGVRREAGKINSRILADFAMHRQIRRHYRQATRH